MPAGNDRAQVIGPAAGAELAGPGPGILPVDFAGILEMHASIRIERFNFDWRHDGCDRFSGAVESQLENFAGNNMLDRGKTPRPRILSVVQ